MYKLKKNILSYIKIKNKQCSFVFCLFHLPLCVCLLVWFLNKRGFVLPLLRLRALASPYLNTIFLCLLTTSQHLLCASLSTTFLDISRFSLCLQVRLRLRLHQYSSAILVWQIWFILS